MCFSKADQTKLAAKAMVTNWNIGSIKSAILKSATFEIKSEKCIQLECMKDYYSPKRNETKLQMKSSIVNVLNDEGVETIMVELLHHGW